MNNHPLRPTLVETQSESESLLETKFEPESEITTEMHSETTAHQIYINRDLHPSPMGMQVTRLQ